jgi:hypothetical protein
MDSPFVISEIVDRRPPNDYFNILKAVRRFHLSQSEENNFYLYVGNSIRNWPRTWRPMIHCIMLTGRLWSPIRLK